MPPRSNTFPVHSRSVVVRVRLSQPGVLNRITGVIARRGYNVQASLPPPLGPPPAPFEPGQGGARSDASVACRDRPAISAKRPIS